MILVGQHDSPYTRRVAISLMVLGIPYEHDTRSVFGDFDSMRKTNPLGRIPSLVLVKRNMSAACRREGMSFLRPRNRTQCSTRL